MVLVTKNIRFRTTHRKLVCRLVVLPIYVVVIMEFPTLQPPRNLHLKKPTHNLNPYAYKISLIPHIASITYLTGCVFGADCAVGLFRTPFRHCGREILSGNWGRIFPALPFLSLTFLSCPFLSLPFLGWLIIETAWSSMLYFAVIHIRMLRRHITDHAVPILGHACDPPSKSATKTHHSRKSAPNNARRKNPAIDLRPPSNIRRKKHHSTYVPDLLRISLLNTGYPSNKIQNTTHRCKPPFYSPYNILDRHPLGSGAFLS